MEFDPMNPLGTSEEYYDDYVTLFLDQPDYMPAKGYSKRFNTTERKQVYDNIISNSRKIDDPFVSFIAMNHFDRYISRQPPLNLKGLDIDLSARSCFKLAVKMTSSCSSTNALPSKNKIVKNVEDQIMGVLEGKTRPITALCFLEFFVLNFNLNNAQMNLDLKVAAIRIIMISQREIRVSEYLASVVAAAALVVASKEMFPARYEEFKEAVANSPFVDKDEVRHCIDTIMLELLQPLGPWRSAAIEVGVQKVRKKIEAEIRKDRK
ncbi:putative cyclin-D6-1 [Cornus florida]|uniref:putative cyclin-D6-1 n=1 Tax=Cornus florida TaxID=4283 RepID=UPI0028A2C270|nr:putative cyclin-D6-1 [Cornus florida]